MRIGIINFVLISVLIFIYPVSVQAMEEGNASWYGGKFQGRLTASGEIFDTEKFTAAHKTLPFGTIVKVTNLENDQFTIVRINDRGPFVKSRIIDLSRAAAGAIDMLAAGIARVKLEILGTDVPEPEKIFYIIQTGCFSQAENAYKMREQLEAKGFKVSFEKTNTNLIRVLLPDITSLELDKIKETLKELNLTDLIIKKMIMD